MSASIVGGGLAQRTELVWARCVDLIASLDIPVPFDVFELCQRVAVLRGVLMVVEARDTTRAENVSGFWVSYADHDLVVYDGGTTAYHRDGIVLHELGHILFDHYPAGDFAEHIAKAFPDVAGAAHQMLGSGRCRFDYSEREEEEAETFATLVLERYVTAAADGADPVTAGVADQLQSTFEA